MPTTLHCTYLLQTDTLMAVYIHGRKSKTSSKSTKVSPTRLMEARVKSDAEFDKEAATTLAVRGTRQAGDGRYQFTRDLQARAVCCLYR